MAFAVAGAGAGLAAPPAVYRVAGYLDRAPAGTPVLARVWIGAGGRVRLLLVERLRRSDDAPPWSLLEDVGAFDPDFLLRGRRQTVRAVLDAPPGTRLTLKATHVAGSRTLSLDSGTLRLEPPVPTRTPPAPPAANP